jgi:hypothetical protein
MSKSNACENALLQLLFNNVDFANVGDAGGIQNSAAAGSYYISLHTADPGEAGNQTTNEATYGSYARVAVARTVGGWTVSGSSVSNAAQVTFEESTSGTNVITHFGIGTASSGSGVLMYSGALSSSRTVEVGGTPFFAIGAATVTED